MLTVEVEMTTAVVAERPDLIRDMVMVFVGRKKGSRRLGSSAADAVFMGVPLNNNAGDQNRTFRLRLAE